MFNCCFARGVIRSVIRDISVTDVAFVAMKHHHKPGFQNLEFKVTSGIICHVHIKRASFPALSSMRPQTHTPIKIYYTASLSATQDMN